jgi:hypothetical protein
MGFLLSSKIGGRTLKPGGQREGDLPGARVFFMGQGLKDHPLHSGHVNEIKVKGALTGLLQTVLAVTLGQPEEFLGLSESSPGEVSG